MCSSILQLSYRNYLVDRGTSDVLEPNPCGRIGPVPVLLVLLNRDSEQLDPGVSMSPKSE